MGTPSLEKSAGLSEKTKNITDASSTAALSHLKPDITVSLLRREINFITSSKMEAKR